MTIHPDTEIATIGLNVADMGRSRAFYERALGLRATELTDGTLAVGVPGEAPLLELHADGSEPSRGRPATGLYHLAILVPTRADLALALARLLAARWPLDGAADHLVSEALYLSDPEGNGVEIYHDRPRERWPRAPDGVAMATLPLDLDDLLGQRASRDSPPGLMPDATRIGHVHLKVADLARAEAFYAEGLGFEVTMRGLPGALFLAAGGYHHHIGLNTWRSAGASPPPPGSIGLRSFAVRLPSRAELERVLDRLRAAGVEVERSERAMRVRDPSGNTVQLRGPG